MDHTKILADAIRYIETGKGTHEWTFNTKKEAVQLANFLRGYNYKVQYKHYPTLEYLGLGHYIKLLK
jgi:hypothetical protein